ncbi:hypothetical protein HWV62_28658 [Athelia sp. TMB]|nr:hypothetical protein HWV62_28658 [Athelia sp. TMB]
MRWDQHEIHHRANRHSKPSKITSEGVVKHEDDASIHAGADEGALPSVKFHYKASTSATEKVVLAMPDGAYTEKYRNIRSIREYTVKNAQTWYDFINGPKGLDALNGSVYVVTSCDKATAWGIATAEKSDSSHDVSFKFTAALKGAGAGAGVGYSCSWSQSSGTITRHSVDTEFQPHNQCLFINGFKVMIREGLEAKVPFRDAVKLKSTGKLKNPKPKHFRPSGKTYPGAGSGGGVGAGDPGNSSQPSSGGQDSRETQIDDDDWSDDWSDDSELDSHGGAYHPLDTINKYLLDNTEADVATAHESDWWPLSTGPNLASAEEILRRIPDHYIPVVDSRSS